MKQKNYHSCTVGQIVAGNFDTTKVFSRYHIDFCCHGNTPFAEACRNRGIDPEAVAHELNELQENTVSNAPDFAGWPIDLLIDYVLKIHHRGIRSANRSIISQSNRSAFKESSRVIASPSTVPRLAS